MNRLRIRGPLLSILFGLQATAHAVPNAPELEPLPTLQIDRARITASGISSGVFMAGQLHVAYSDLFSGTALVAGRHQGIRQWRLATGQGQSCGPKLPKGA